MTDPINRLYQWFDNEAVEGGPPGIDWLRVMPFLALHVASLAVLWVGFSPVALLAAVMMYAIRMFAITAFYHRYFSHRAFKTSRWLQFAFALIAATATQRGPLWWASHHRNHHRHSDSAEDAHSPQRGFWWSHLGWFLDSANFPPRKELIRDFSCYRELRFLDRYDFLAPILAAVTLFALGAWLESVKPELNTNGWQMLVWGFVISTIVLYHATFTINSLAHRCGSRRYATRDSSRNNAWLALMTFGEGWHNNHHHFPGSARQGFYWWEIDVTWYGLKLMSWLGLIWDIRPVPAIMRDARRAGRQS
jgi:stearoyl-CoA desaturase (delta-9 desaturase)